MYLRRFVLPTYFFMTGALLLGVAIIFQPRTAAATCDGARVSCNTYKCKPSGGANSDACEDCDGDSYAFKAGSCPSGYNSGTGDCATKHTGTKTNGMCMTCNNYVGGCGGTAVGAQCSSERITPFPFTKLGCGGSAGWRGLLVPFPLKHFRASVAHW